MSSPAPPPTLDDVARLAQVSTATVSRCLNDPKMVSKPTRERVEAAIANLGYTPNFAARSMAAKRTFTIGAIVPTLDNAIFARGLQAFQETLGTRGYTLLVASSAYKAEVEQEQIRTLVARGADGVLVIGQDRDPAIYDYLERQSVPVLAVWSYDPEGALPSIGFDNRATMRALASAVLDLGHRHIAMISAFAAQNDRARGRIDGVRDAMQAAGLAPQDLLLEEVTYTVEDGAQAFARLAAQTPRPSAVLCGNDVLAAGALRAARQLGIRVPQDISVTGFDDMELARVVSPELTTVRVPHADMGKRAAEELVDMIEGKRAGRSHRLAAEIVHRASLGPPPSNP